MAKLKIKDLEGTLKDINELFQEHNCDLSSYIGAEKSVPKGIPLLLIVSILFHFVVACILWAAEISETLYKILFLGLIFSAITIIFCVYLKFKNPTLTLLCIVGAMIIIVIALNISTPQDTMKKVEEVLLNLYDK